jgi:hypothetical protein
VSAKLLEFGQGVRVSLVAMMCGVGSLGGGCGSIVHGSSQNINLNTNPQGATVNISNGMTFTTPSQVKLERNKDYILTFSKDGYATQNVPLNSVLSGWLAGNIIFGGIIGGGIDLATGAAYTLTPEQFIITLQPLRSGEVAAPATAPASMSIEEKLRAAERLHKDGVLKDVEYEATKKKLTEQLTKPEGTKDGKAPNAPE